MSIQYSGLETSILSDLNQQQIHLLYPGEERRSWVWRPLHLSVWHIHINRFNTYLKTEDSSYLDNGEEALFWAVSVLHKPNISLLSHQESWEKQGDAGKAGGQPLLFGRSTYFT